LCVFGGRGRRVRQGLCLVVCWGARRMRGWGVALVFVFWEA
jgi:hypothetical protein